MLRKALKWVGLLVLVVLMLGAGYVGYAVNAYGRSMSQSYDIPLPALAASTDSLVIERGRHLAESVAGSRCRPPRRPGSSVVTPLTIQPCCAWVPPWVNNGTDLFCFFWGYPCPCPVPPLRPPELAPRLLRPLPLHRRPPVSPS